MVLLLLPLATAEEWIYKSSSMLLKTSIYSDFDIIRGAKSELKYVTVNLSFFPQDTAYQQVISIDYFPEPTIDDTLFFKWENPTENSLGFRVDTLVRTTKNIGKVANKVKFPLTDIPDDVKQYTKPSNIIDSDTEDIINLASNIVEGENDLFVIAYKIGRWVEDNVEYDLNTVTLDASQKASWVLEHKQGVCDEITNLFIAMMRSLGVPARFVSGISYTNLPQFPDKWGPHGWAEVYFPGFGWVPFDITYSEYGYTDATHITETISTTAEKLSTKYKWLGRNVDIETKKLNIDVDVQSKSTSFDKDLSLKTNVMKADVAFGSYNLIETNVKNLENYYIATLINIVKVNALEITPKKQHVLLKPGEEKKIYWIVKVSAGLDKDYLYTFPIAVYTPDNTSARSSFVSSSQGTYHSKEEIETLFTGLKQEETKTYSEDININCNAEKTEHNLNEAIKVNCVVENRGNSFLKSLKICLKDDCSLFDLGISQEKSFSLTGFSSIKGINDLEVEVSNKDISETTYVSIIVLDKPELTINNLSYPKTISFNEIKQVLFTIKKGSFSNPRDIKLYMLHNGIGEATDIESIERTEKIVLNINGKDFSVGKNTFKIVIDYKDKDGNSYITESEEFYITLNKVGFWQRTSIFFADIGRWFRRVF